MYFYLVTVWQGFCLFGWLVGGGVFCFLVLRSCIGVLFVFFFFEKEKSGIGRGGRGSEEPGGRGGA